MKPRDVLEFVTLAAIWGASFLFMRIAVPAFGPLVVADLRTAIAAIVLLALVAWRGGLTELAPNALRFLVLGALNSAIPFTLFAYAALSITAGLASIMNATVPLFAALVAWIWLRDRLTWTQWVGLAIGFTGVLWLSADEASFTSGGSGWAIAATLVASLSYGISGTLAKRYFSHIRPLAVAAGSQIGASTLLLPLTLFHLPSVTPDLHSWLALVALGILCTGIAYALYFRLLARVGPTKSMAVTFLVPAFAILWGVLFLDETVTLAMLGGCAVILFGTALATQIISSRR
ncbi:MAG: DMT family transporter [Burkholderiaceae bacterium]|nr:DMT family transporter [Burkholderiaceae bacterium]